MESREGNYHLLFNTDLLSSHRSPVNMDGQSHAALLGESALTTHVPPFIQKSGVHGSIFGAKIVC